MSAPSAEQHSRTGIFITDNGTITNAPTIAKRLHVFAVATDNTCPICYESNALLDSTAPIAPTSPIMLNQCLHVICFQCLTSIVDNAPIGYKGAKCPLCRAAILQADKPTIWRDDETRIPSTWPRMRAAWERRKVKCKAKWTVIKEKLAALMQADTAPVEVGVMMWLR